MKEFVYNIQGLFPPKEEGLGQWGFSAKIGGDFARISRDKKIEERIYDGLVEQGREIIKRFNFGFDEEINPYRPMEDSWLLHVVHVPGDACDIALDEDGLRSYGENWGERRKRIIEQERSDQEILPARYVPHNVDSKDQAFCLATLWNYWMETAELLLEE